MEISAQELRIGNYINGSIGDDSELVLCYVTGYDPRDEFIFVSNDNNIHYAEFVDFQPIPLTKEWLLKLGFVFLSDIGVYKLKFTISTQAGEFEFAGVPKSIGFISNGLFASGNIIWVHQLQNLYFSLCGEELIIKQLA